MEDSMFGFLPQEIVLEIFSHLDTRDLLTCANRVCREWNWLISSESSRGRLCRSLFLDAALLLVKEEDGEEEERPAVEEVLGRVGGGCSEVTLRGFSTSSSLRSAAAAAAALCPRLSSLRLQFGEWGERGPPGLDTGLLEDLRGLAALGVSSESESSRTAVLSARLCEALSASLPALEELRLPGAPSGFVPLLLQNKPHIAVLELGELPNELVYIICQAFCKTLRSFSFRGGLLSYSGVVSLLQCRGSLKTLRIRDPYLLTKYSLRMLARLDRLEYLDLYWLGKTLITNPWSFDYCMDRHEQRIDSLFSKGTLRRLDRLGLSAFYQTVDNKSVQRICSEQLSSQSLAELHLTRVDLSHCYQVGDAGAQWLVGSRHSPRLLELDLSGTDVTGNCFLRRLPELRKLRMEGCVSLCGAGLANIAASCPQLEELSLAKCKQLSDGDVREPLLKSPLTKSLRFLDLGYTAVTGSFFSSSTTTSSQLRRLNLSCCSRLRDDHASTLFSAFPNLERLDVSATSVTCRFLSGGEPRFLSKIWMDFCPRARADQLDAAELASRAPRLRTVSAYGNPAGGFVPEWAARLRKISNGSIKFVTVSSPCEGGYEDTSAAAASEYARQRGLHLTDWMMTKNRMVKGKPFMLSPFWLRSLE